MNRERIAIKENRGGLLDDPMFNLFKLNLHRMGIHHASKIAMIATKAYVYAWMKHEVPRKDVK